MKPEERMAAIESALKATFNDLTRCEVQDDSHEHAGHRSHGGMGHFTVRLTSPDFAGKSLIQRHRMVYAALGELMQTDIHAVSIDTDTP